MRSSVVLMLVLLWAAGCADGREVKPPSAAGVALVRVSSCGEAESYLRERALAHMNAVIDARKAEGGCSLDAGVLDSVAETGGSASAYSTTNNQVAGVDEADFIKNDGKYVYAALNGAFRIVEAWPAAQAREIANVKLEGTPKKLFVAGDRALVYVSKPLAGQGAGDEPYSTIGECTYGYDCEFAGDGTSTDLVLFDINQRNAPKQLRRLELSGSLLAARRIGNTTHTVVVTSDLGIRGVSYDIPTDLRCDSSVRKSEIDAAYEKLRAKNRQLILEAKLGGIVPSVREAGVELTDSCASLYREPEPNGAGFTSVVSLELDDITSPSISTVISKPGAVYASAEAMYMGVNHEKQESGNRQLFTVLHKFQLGEQADATRYVASGTAKGHILNQFSMDEHAGNLRVASSYGRTPDPNVHSTLSVLQQRGSKLAVVGKVDDIAPTEDIRSVRFSGERGFMVTFKKTDPLYVFDLSRPEAPAILGELKIPGFSTYMHLLDDKHLLTIGYDAADQGSFAYFTGVLLQIFDVSDPDHPQLAHKLVVGTRGSSSEALTNQLAFTLFQGKLAVPMTICEGGSDRGSFGSEMTFSGLMVFDVSVEEGLHERGRIAHPGIAGSYDSQGCSSWWTRASSVVKRSLFMDEFVYSVAPDVMRVQNVNALGSDVSVVPLNW